MESKHSFSLRENVRLRLLKDMLSGLKINFPDVPNFILVVDALTTRIVSSCAKMIELLEEGVVALERLDLKRKSFPRMHAIYFITPTESSIDAMLADFKGEPQYGNIHIFFTNIVDKPLLEKMARFRPLAERVATFKEINLDFLSPEANVFHFDMPEALGTIFSKPDLRQTKKLEETIAYKLSTVIPTLFDYEQFHIIYNKNATNGAAERVAKTLKDRLTRFVEIKKKTEEKSDEKPAPIKVVILDRSFDPLTPLLHDYYYQSMILELLTVKGEEVEYEDEAGGQIVTKKAYLTEEDDLWTKYKYQFIGEAMTSISKEFEEFVATNKSAQMSKMNMNELNLEQMSNIIKQMPMYQALMTKYTLHLTLIEQCVKAFTEKDLKDLGEMEQSLATGIDGTGKPISNQKLIALIAGKLANGKVDAQIALRLMMIASIALELQERDKKALIQRLSDDDKEILNKLFWLGVDPAKFATKKGKVQKKVDETSAAKLKTISTNLCRFTPPIEIFANGIATGEKLDAETYGSLFIPNNYDGSLGQKSKLSASAALRKGGKGGKMDASDERTQPKIIFFVIGGMSYTEIRVLADFAKNNPQFNVVCGSTYIIKPSDYIQGISKMVSKTEYEELKRKE